MLKTRVQNYFKSISDLFRSIVMANISLLMFYGLINTLFSERGYFPLDLVQNAMPLFAKYLIPLAIAYTSGSLIHEKKGSSIALAVTSILIWQQEHLNILGIMLIACLAVTLYQRIESYLIKKVVGYEMLITNILVVVYSLGGMLLSAIVFAPLLDALMDKVLAVAMWLSNTGWIALANILIEPAKVFNLNNAVNNVLLTPIGLEQVNRHGSSILFFLEANPGPGLGLLLAFLILSKGKFRKDVQTSSIIHTVGGIHELYFPYALMSKWLFLPLILGGIVGSYVVSVFSAGLTGPVSPGSLIPILLLSPKENLGSIMLAVVMSTLVSCLTSIAVMLLTKQDFSDYAVKVKRNIIQTYHGEPIIEQDQTIHHSGYHKIIFACDAGMGSSAIGASILANKLKEKEINIPVEHSSITNLTETENALIITQTNLKQRVQEKDPNAKILTLMNYLDQTFYNQVVADLERSNE